MHARFADRVDGVGEVGLVRLDHQRWRDRAGDDDVAGFELLAERGERVGDMRDDVDERNNRWALYSSLERGMDNVRLIAVWDGKIELAQDRDARQVRHMVDLMRDMGGKVDIINPSKILAEEAIHHIGEKGAEKPPKPPKHTQ